MTQHYVDKKLIEVGNKLFEGFHLLGLFVIGAAAVAHPLDVPETFFTLHFPAMLLILYSFRVFIFLDRDGTFKRWQGVWIFSLYLIYILLQYTVLIED